MTTFPGMTKFPECAGEGGEKVINPTKAGNCKVKRAQLLTQITEAELTGSGHRAKWNPDAGLAHSEAAANRVDAAMRRMLQVLSEGHDEESSASLAYVNQRRQGNNKTTLAAILHADATQVSSSGDEETGTCNTGACPFPCNTCNFGATGATQAQPTGETSEPRGDEVHVAVVYEMEGQGGERPEKPHIMELQAPDGAPEEMLRIPYRSMSAELEVRTGEASSEATTKVRVIVDSGAAQCGVSSSWLKKYPGLWDSRRRATHKFHSVTGERLSTDGVVRLAFRLGSHWFTTWAHVFNHMHSKILLGTNAIVENALVIDGGSLELAAKGVPGAATALEYKLALGDNSINVLAQGQQAATVKATRVKRRKPIVSPMVPAILHIDTCIPARRASPDRPSATDEQPTALLIQLDDPMIGQASDWWVTPARKLTSDYPQLQVWDTVFSSSERLAYMTVVNHGDADLTLPKGTVIGGATRFQENKHCQSNEDGVGRLTFKVQQPKSENTQVTRETLIERGLDLSGACDLGRPGAPPLSAEQMRQLEDVWIECEEALAVDPKRPGNSDYMLIRINTGDATPQASKPYSIPYAHQEAVRLEIQKLLRYGLISPCMSAWASPVLVVVKKDHTGENFNIKLATDLRKLNAKTEMDSGAIGDMSEIVDKFNGRPYASCCDVSSGYYSFLIHPEDRHKLCFVLPMSIGGTTFCWNRAPYGVARLPAEFSRAIMTILGGMHEEVSSFVDDLTLHTVTFERHLAALRAMLRRLILARITLKGSKCLILPKRLELLGFDVTPGGLHMQHKKSREFSSFPEPTSRDEVQKYLGAVQFYRRWIDNLGTLAAPLTDLLKKRSNFVFGEKERAAFRAINEILESDIAMAFPDLKDPNADYWVFTDASDVAVSGILMQRQWDEASQSYRPKTLAHFSKVLDDTQRKWAIYEKESVALVFAVTHWRKHLLGRKFTCFTDSSVALTMMSKQRHTSKMQRWGMLLQEYMPGMSMGFKRSEENGGADSLSRAATFSKFVPQPRHTMEFDDSLFDRVYELPTNVRGAFSLHVPRNPIDLSKMWDISTDATPAEVIAFADACMKSSQRQQNTSEALQMQLMRERLRVGEDDQRANERLLELEKTVCQCLIDPATAHRTAGDQAYAHLTHHYGNYVDAYTAHYGHRPMILSFADDRGYFAIGAELAGCRVRVDKRAMTEPTEEVEVSLDHPSGWFTEPLAGVHAYGDVDFHIAAAVASLSTHAPPSIQVDVDGAVHATNFDVHNPGVDASADATVMRKNANHMAHRANYATCTEHSVQASYSTAEYPEIAHGQLLAGQMVAAFMHRQHGMPLWRMPR